MSQKDPTRATVPIVHRYDPKQVIPLPPAVLPVSGPATPAIGVAPPASSASDAIKPAAESQPPASRPASSRPVEIGGPSGPEPTRYGDWERNGRVSDF